MKWEGREESQNVEDSRGMRTTGAVVGGGGVLAVIVYFVAQFLGVDPQEAKELADAAKKIAPNVQQQQVGEGRKTTPEEDKMARFSSIVFHDTEVVWGDLFEKMGKRYVQPKLHLFTDLVNTGCGTADSGVGPFYCPRDQKVYIDLVFYSEMKNKFGAPGDFARAYVIAHEVGHHVQRLLGYSQRVDEIRAHGNPVETNHASVRLELQADYLAGVWAHHGEKRFQFLEKGDVETAMKAAFEIGDDRLQMKSRGTVVPDRFTHGTSKQRMKWFMEGLKTGSVENARALFELPYNGL